MVRMGAWVTAGRAVLVVAAMAAGLVPVGARAQVPVPQVGQTYWVRRVVARSGGGCGMANAGEAGGRTCFSNARAVCTPVTFEERAMTFVVRSPGGSRETV